MFFLKALAAFFIGCFGGWIARGCKAPRRLRVSALAFVLIGLAAAEASACSRCGLFGNRCRYYAASTYVAPVAAVVAPSNVYVLQNNYPAPLVGQGTSALISNGGYQSLTAQYYDPTAFLSQSLQLVKAGQDSASLAFSQANSHSAQVVASQAPAFERLVAGQAAATVLDKAAQLLQTSGLDPAHNVSGGSSTGFFIGRGPDGKMQVLQLQASEAQAITQRLSAQTTITQSIASTPAPPVPGIGGEVTSLVAQHCGKCHGQDQAAPKGGLFLHAGATLNGDHYLASKRLMAAGKMPKGGPQLAEEIQREILREIESFIPLE